MRLPWTTDANITNNNITWALATPQNGVVALPSQGTKYCLLHTQYCTKSGHGIRAL